MQNLAPIALFVYNRPEHTRRTLSFLRKNLYAAESKLFVFSDAPYTAKDSDAVDQTRALIRDVEGFKSVVLIERETNMGLAQSIIDGVSQLVAEYGKVIVFEDDLLSSPYALKYFNKALRKYEHANRVMQIGGYMFPLKNADGLPESFFFRATTSWGWATWARAWKQFEPDVEVLYRQFNRKRRRDFSINGTMNYWKQFLDFKKGKNNSWAVRWYASVFLNDGLVLYPRQSLIDNIGHDGSGVHSIIEDTYKVNLSNQPVDSFPDKIEESQPGVNAVQHFFEHRKGSWFKRGRKFLVNKWYRYLVRK